MLVLKKDPNKVFKTLTSKTMVVTIALKQILMNDEQLTLNLKSDPSWTPEQRRQQIRIIGDIFCPAFLNNLQYFHSCLFVPRD